MFFSVEIGRLCSEFPKKFMFRNVCFYSRVPPMVPTLFSVFKHLSMCLYVCLYVYVRIVGDPWKMYLNQPCMLCSARIKAL